MSPLGRNKTVLVVVGPTAAGKTAVAIDLAHQFNTEIISADSRQCFKELNIGVARPSEQELKSVAHHFIASHSIHEQVNAGTFEQYALQKANSLLEARDVVVMVGGTGLYIKAFCEGLDDMPQVPEEIHRQIIDGYKQNGLEWLQKKVESNDPEFHRVGEIQNPHRLMRALEVFETTGRSILSFQKGRKEKRDFNILKIGLELSKDELRRNIQARLDKMIDAGLVEEVRTLAPYKNLNALQTVGYTEIFDYLAGRISLDEAIEAIVKNTRQYAKRQLTWFRKDKAVRWYSSDAVNEIKRASMDALA